MARSSGGGNRAGGPLDRNPTDATGAYGATGVAPHGDTARLSYTVPTKRSADVTLIGLAIVRDATSGAPLQAYAQFRITPSGSTAKNSLTATNYSGAVGGGTSLAVGSSLILGAGDILACASGDASTGGTHYIQVSNAIKEYDA